MKIKLNWDGLGIFTSIVCAIHCGVLPFLLPALPLFGINIIHNTFFEWFMIVLAFAVGIYSLYHGYKKHYHSRLPFGLFFLGFIFLVAKQFFPAFEYLFLVFAVIPIISAHLLNYRYCKRIKCSSPHHSH